MNTFRLVISSSCGIIFNEDIIKVTLFGVDGELAVMAGHIPFVTAVKSCEVRIVLGNEDIKTGKTLGGFLSVSKDKTSLVLKSFDFGG